MGKQFGCNVSMGNSLPLLAQQSGAEIEKKKSNYNVTYCYIRSCGIRVVTVFTVILVICIIICVDVT